MLNVTESAREWLKDWSAKNKVENPVLRIVLAGIG